MKYRPLISILLILSLLQPYGWAGDVPVFQGEDEIVHCADCDQEPHCSMPDCAKLSHCTSAFILSNPFHLDALAINPINRVFIQASFYSHLIHTIYRPPWS